MSTIKVAIIGTGHLAETTEEACAKHFDTACNSKDADLVWFCENMPVNEDDVSDVTYITETLGWWLDNVIVPGTPVLVSSQIPVGTCATWEKRWPEHTLIVQPENIRREHAAADFHCQRRIIVGYRGEPNETVNTVLRAFCPDPDGIMWMSPESAEMTKHALNAWLAMNICYANEIADLCALVGADIDDVFRGFRSDRRVRGPLTPGDPITGGTLLRDVAVLRKVDQMMIGHPLIHAIGDSNLEQQTK